MLNMSPGSVRASRLVLRKGTQEEIAAAVCALPPGKPLDTGSDRSHQPLGAVG